MKHYSKSDVEFHSANYYAPYYSAVNVKVKGLYPLEYKIEDEFNCSEETAEKALQFAFDSACDLFWNDEAQSIADDTFDYDVKIYSAGRSGGWLIVIGLPDFDTWDAINLSKWHSFENKIKAEVNYLTSWEAMKDAIDANRWAEEGAEQYNFYEKSDGESFCLVDWKNEQLDKLGIQTVKLIRSCEW